MNWCWWQASGPKGRLRPFSASTLLIGRVHLWLALGTLKFIPLSSCKRFVEVLLACGCPLTCPCSFSFLGLSTRAGHRLGRARRCLRCAAWRGLLFSLLGAGLLDLPGPLILLTGFEAGFGEPVSCPSLAGELVISGWLELWDAAASLEVAFQSPCNGGSNKFAASLEALMNYSISSFPFTSIVWEKNLSWSI